MGKSLTPRTTNNPEGPDTGEAAAAIKNRQVGARLQIVAALQRLGVPYREWPDFVQKFHAKPTGAGPISGVHHSPWISAP